MKFSIIVRQLNSCRVVAGLIIIEFLQHLFLPSSIFVRIFSIIKLKIEFFSLGFCLFK